MRGDLTILFAFIELYEYDPELSRHAKPLIYKTLKNRISTFAPNNFLYHCGVGGVCPLLLVDLIENVCRINYWFRSLKIAKKLSHLVKVQF